MPVTDQTSTENSKKLDEVLSILKGQGDSFPGLISTVHAHSLVLYGREGKLGVTQKVAVLWRVHVWLLCTASAAAGYLLKMFTH